MKQGSQPATAAAPQQTPTRMLVHDYPSPEHPASLKPSPTPTYHSRHPSPPEAVTTSTTAAAGCRSRACTPPAPPSCPAACPQLRPQHRAAVCNRALTHPQGSCNKGAHAPCCSTPGWVQRRCCGPTGQHLTAHVPAQLLLLSKLCARYTFGALCTTSCRCSAACLTSYLQHSPQEASAAFCSRSLPLLLMPPPPLLLL